MSSRGGMLLGSILAALSAMPAKAAEPMVTGSLTSQPIGHYEFCKANPAECNVRMRDAGPATMSGELWKTLVEVNTSGQCRR